MVRHLMLIAMLAMLAGKAVAQNDGCCDCPDCGHKVCIAKPITKKESKTVFNVEKKQICIPKIRFPWQAKAAGCGSNCDSSCDQNGNCGCAPLCGRVKTVKVLKKKKIECEKCGYKWEITTVESTPCQTQQCQTPQLRSYFSSRRGGVACDQACDASAKK